MKTLLILSAMLLIANCERIMYFHYNSQQYPNNINLAGIKNNPVYKVYDCSTYDCDRFVKTEYPAMFYWKGPGSAFERIHQHTQQAIREHFNAKQIGYANKFKRWIEDISLFETFVYAILIAGLLFTVFTKLFTPPHHKRSHHHGHLSKEEKQL